MSYDPKVFELGWDFILAGERYRVLDMEKIPAKAQHEMCGLFKQSTFGDIDIKYDGTQGAVFNNMTAWSNCRGMSKVDAIKRYVTMANQLVEAYNK